MSRLLLALPLLLLATPAWAEQAPPAAEATRPGRIILRWKPLRDDRPQRLLRREGKQGPWTRVADLRAGDAAYEDREVKGRRAYCYRVDLLGDAPAEGVPSAPVEVLASFYLQLREVRGEEATLYVWVFDPAFTEWQRSDPFTVRAGDAIGAIGVVTDFRTHAKLKAVGQVAEDPSVHFAVVETKEGEPLRVTTKDVLPEAVDPPKKEGGEQKRPSAIASLTRPRPKAEPKPTSRPTRLKFPQPKRIGSAPGTKVKWDIVNRSHVPFTISIVGKSARRLFKVGPDKTHEVRLKRGGNFAVTAQAPGSHILDLYAEFGLESGSEYRTELGLEKRVKGKKP